MSTNINQRHLSNVLSATKNNNARLVISVTTSAGTVARLEVPQADAADLIDALEGMVQADGPATDEMIEEENEATQSQPSSTQE